MNIAHEAARSALAFGTGQTGTLSELFPCETIKPTVCTPCGSALLDR